MRNRGILVGLLAGVLLWPGAAVQADPVTVGSTGSASVHDQGHPTTAEPWRTLTMGTFAADGVRDEWTATAVLAGPAPATRSIVVNWGLGIQHPQGCEIQVQFAEVDPVVAADATITMFRTTGGEALDQQYSCLEVVLSTDGVTTDIVTGPMTPYVRTSGVDSAPAGGIVRVAAGRRTPTIVMVTSHVAASAGATVSGAGIRTHVRRVTTGPVLADRARPVVVWTKAERGRSRVDLVARDGRDSSSLDRTWPVVARAIKAQRPLPGRYESGDGRVGFKVNREFQVRHVRVTDLTCVESGRGGYNVRVPESYHLPRSGATAKVTTLVDPQLGDGYRAVQLLTTGRRTVLGSFSVAGYGCTGSLRFVAKRQD